MLRIAPLLGGMSGREKEMAAHPAVCFGFTEVTCIAVGGQNHIAGMVGEDGVFLGC